MLLAQRRHVGTPYSLHEFVASLFAACFTTSQATKLLDVGTWVYKQHQCHDIAMWAPAFIAKLVSSWIVNIWIY